MRRSPPTENLIMKAQRVHWIAVVLLGMAISACGPTEQELPKDIILAMQTHYNDNDAEGAANLYTDDGAIMQEFARPIHGKAAILDFLHDNLRKQLQYWITSEGSMASGNIGYDQGSYRVRDINQVKDMESGKYVIIYKKVHGEWKIYRNIYNTDSLKLCAFAQEMPTPQCGDGDKKTK